MGSPKKCKHCGKDDEIRDGICTRCEPDMYELAW